MVARFCFGGREVIDRFKQPPMIEPVHPLQRGELHRSAFRHGQRGWIASALKRAMDGFGEGVVITVADAVH